MFPENTVEKYMEHCFSGHFLRKPPRATGRLKGKKVVLFSRFGRVQTEIRVPAFL